MSVLNHNNYNNRKSLCSKGTLININSIFWFLFGLQLLMANISKHSIYYQMSALLFIAATSLYLLLRRSIKINKYFIITMVFIFYNLILILLGDSVNVSHSITMLKTISINLILFVITYSFLVYANDTEKLLKLYISISALSNIIILFVFRESLFTGRLAFSWGNSASDYKLLGIEVITAGSNGIAYFSAIAFILSTYLLITKGKKKYLIYDILFLFTTLATGSRKGLLILGIGFVFLIYVLNNKSKKVIYGITAILLTIALYYLTQSIPVFYEVIGYRMEELFNLLLGREVNDVSISTRMALIQQAIGFIKQNPILGYGLDAFRILGPWGIVVDNNYLDILVSSGLIGFLIYYSYVLFVLRDYVLLRKKSNICKLFFCIFLLNLIMEYGSVTYFERNFGFINVMLFYILQKEKKEERNGSEK